MSILIWHAVMVSLYILIRNQADCYLITLIISVIAICNSKYCKAGRSWLLYFIVSPLLSEWFSSIWFFTLNRWYRSLRSRRRQLLMISMSSWSYFLSCSTALDCDGCWSMSIQFVVRLVCMSADIGGVDFSSAAWLAVERSGRCILRQWWGLIALVVVGGCSWGWLLGWWRRGSGWGRGGRVDRSDVAFTKSARRLVVG